MRIIGEVDSLWRYPVKSMRGEELDEVFVGYSGVYGDDGLSPAFALFCSNGETA